MPETNDNVREKIDPNKNVIIFPAYGVGYSELNAFIHSMDQSGLLHRILFIFPPDMADIFQSRVIHRITDAFETLPELIAKLESWITNALPGTAISGIIGIDEEEQFTLSREIARRFHLDFYNDRTCSLASNKFLMKRMFERKQVPTGRFLLLSPDAYDETAIHDIGFPNILKVLSGNGSAYLFKNDTMDQLQAHMNYLKTRVRALTADNRFRVQRVDWEGEPLILDPKHQFLLEAYIPGEEFSCDFMKQGTDLQIIRVVKKFKGPYLGYFNGYLLLTEADLQANGIDHSYLTEICRRISDAFSIHAGVCMVDFKIHQGKLNVIEASIRPGLSAFNHLMAEIYGYTSLTVMARQKLGLKTDIRFPKETGAIIYLYCAETEIAFSMDVSALEPFKQEYKILHIHTFEESSHGSGPIADPRCDRSPLLRGYVLLKNPDAAQLPELADRLNASVTYIPTPNPPSRE
ncbi:MAG: ATP-grasp domain-containing protein [Candidatus Omnitrophota bacterium]